MRMHDREHGQNAFRRSRRPQVREVPRYNKSQAPALPTVPELLLCATRWWVVGPCLSVNGTIAPWRVRSPCRSPSRDPETGAPANWVDEHALQALG